MNKFSNLNKDQKHLVIGGSGLIGSELVKELVKQNLNVVGTYTSKKALSLHYFNMLENDWSIFETLKHNDIVYLMSAYSNPNWIAKNRDLAYTLNLIKTKKLIIVYRHIFSRRIFNVFFNNNF